MLCAIWYHLYNLKNAKSTHGGKLILIKLLRVTLLHGCFSRFLNCTNGTKSRKASHIFQLLSSVSLLYFMFTLIQNYNSSCVKKNEELQKDLNLESGKVQCYSFNFVLSPQDVAKKLEVGTLQKQSFGGAFLNIFLKKFLKFVWKH